MIIATAQTKGGSGKTALSINVAPMLFEGQDFQLMEIDSNNDSQKAYHASTMLLGKFKSISVADADHELDGLFFDALTTDTNVILDLGGGHDSIAAIKLLHEQPGQENIRYLIPLLPGDDIDNIVDTWQLIERKENIIFVLNAYHFEEKIEEEFLDFFGSQALNVESIADRLEQDINYVRVPFNNFFKLAKRYGMNILDLAAMSEELNPDEASKVFLEKAKGDRSAYAKLYAKYKASQRAAKVVETIRGNLKNGGTLKKKPEKRSQPAESVSKTAETTGKRERNA